MLTGADMIETINYYRAGDDDKAAGIIPMF